jgi:hypothetical protein
MAVTKKLKNRKTKYCTARSDPRKINVPSQNVSAASQDIRIPIGIQAYPINLQSSTEFMMDYLAGNYILYRLKRAQSICQCHHAGDSPGKFFFGACGEKNFLDC